MPSNDCSHYPVGFLEEIFADLCLAKVSNSHENCPKYSKFQSFEFSFTVEILYAFRKSFVSQFLIFYATFVICELSSNFVDYKFGTVQ